MVFLPWNFSLSLVSSSCFICLHHRHFLFPSPSFTPPVLPSPPWSVGGWVGGWVLALVCCPLSGPSVPARSRAVSSAPGGHRGLRSLPPTSGAEPPEQTGTERGLKVSVLHSHQRQSSRVKIVFLQNFEDVRAFHIADEKSDLGRG
ncbi:hypothetical protein HJG60_007766 [Phyllostomus discolor]|uniref:Uncharacterized protein n=1 Tax=Phyllostomus discolor TaxID=89673 RepID=A0A834BDP2_9CHIR|nr:hypothetical protein HJG60_007766 [Phyllostomus discolor]